jgi:RNA polymerase sigma-70 factor (ECF subfamily)
MNENDLILIWNNNKEKIISYIRKDIERKDIVDDILQEIFIKFWENHNDIKDEGKILQWLLSVTRFTIADYFRVKKRNNTTLDNITIDICSKENPENCTQDESRKLLPIIHSLPKKYENILILSDIHGFSHKDVAIQFNLSISCVKKRVERGRKLLAQKMHECCAFTHDKYGNIVNCYEKDKYKEILKASKLNVYNVTF